MPDTIINIVMKPGDRIEPDSGIRARVKTRSVKFTAGAPVKGLKIIFEGESPFGKKSVPYETSLPIVAKLHKTDPTKNVYGFVCEATVNGKPVRGKGKIGGEIELIPE